MKHEIRQENPNAVIYNNIIDFERDECIYI